MTTQNSEQDASLINRTAIESTGIEKIPAWNGKTEDKIVFASILLIFLVASLLLAYLYPAKQNNQIATPKSIRQSLTELSNAAEELMMIRDMEGRMPSLQSLQEMGVVPFATEHFKNKTILDWQYQDNCFVARTLQPQTAPDQETYLVKLVLPEGDVTNVSPYHISWRVGNEDFHSMNRLCEPSSSKPWNQVNTLNPREESHIGDQHVH